MHKLTWPGICYSLTSMDFDLQVRLTAFDWLFEQTRIHGDVLPRKLLETGYFLNQNRIPLLAPQGIFKPKILDLPLSITTVPNSPYHDSFREYVMYKYRGTDAAHRDNVGLRRLMELKRPLIYFFGITPGQYLATWPVYVVDDDLSSLSFRIEVDETASLSEKSPVTIENPEIRRAYVTASVRQRLHQRLFRERVLDAYQSRCSFCNLRHRELLDAAHILPDSEPEGDPMIQNGLALCKLHHAALDSYMICVSPDHIIHVRQDILEEQDGPMLQHGLKELNEGRLLLPTQKRHWPFPEFLERRWARFRKAS